MNISPRTIWKSKYAVLSVCLFSAGVFAQPEGDGLLGKWLLDDKTAIFDFYRAGYEYRARIITLAKPNLVDTNNPVDSLKTRKIAGLTLVHGLVYEAKKKKWGGGRVYNPENGKTYSCNCTLSADGVHLLFRGYLGVSLLGETRTWTRMAPGN
jgi:uncharacterized protein (DUF2147 family)